MMTEEQLVEIEAALEDKEAVYVLGTDAVGLIRKAVAEVRRLRQKIANAKESEREACIANLENLLKVSIEGDSDEPDAWDDGWNDGLLAAIDELKVSCEFADSPNPYSDLPH